MPTYAYRCIACDHRFDATQRFADDPLTECPACGGLVKRVIGPVGVVFKGSGWYITDSRKSSEATNGGKADAPKKDGAKTKDDAPRPADTAKAAKTEPKADAKPAAV